MRNLIHTISLAGGLLCTSLLNAQGIFSTSELYKSTRSIGMGGITAVSAPTHFPSTKMHRPLPTPIGK